MMLGICIFVLALAGIADALYFTFAYYGRIKKVRWVPEFLCAREGSNCVTVVQTPYARVLGPPNSLLGFLYYLGIMIWVPWFSASRDAGHISMVSGVFSGALLVASCGSVILGGYLIYALRRRLHTHCPFCYLAHAINVVLFVLLVTHCLKGIP